MRPKGKVVENYFFSDVVRRNCFCEGGKYWKMVQFAQISYTTFSRQWSMEMKASIGQSRGKNRCIEETALMKDKWCSFLMKFGIIAFGFSITFVFFQSSG